MNEQQKKTLVACIILVCTFAMGWVICDRYSRPSATPPPPSFDAPTQEAHPPLILDTE